MQDDYDTSEGENDKVQPMTWVERRRSLSLESMGDLASDAAAISSQAGASYQNVGNNNDDEDEDDNEDDSSEGDAPTHPPLAKKTASNRPAAKRSAAKGVLPQQSSPLASQPLAHRTRHGSLKPCTPPHTAPRDVLSS